MPSDTMDSRRCTICGEIVDAGVAGVREHLRTVHDHEEVARALSEEILVCPECGSERVERGESQRQCWKCGHVWEVTTGDEQRGLGAFVGSD